MKAQKNKEFLPGLSLQATNLTFPCHSEPSFCHSEALPKNLNPLSLRGSETTVAISQVSSFLSLRACQRQAWQPHRRGVKRAVSIVIARDEVPKQSHRWGWELMQDVGVPFMEPAGLINQAPTIYGGSKMKSAKCKKQ